MGGRPRAATASELHGKQAVIAVDLGVAVVHPEVAALVTAGAEALIADAGLARVDVR